MDGLMLLQFLIMTLDGVAIAVMFELMFEPRRNSRKWILIRFLSYWAAMMIISLPEFLAGRKLSRAFNLTLFLIMYISLGKAFYRIKAFDLVKGFIVYTLTALSVELIIVMIWPGFVTGQLDYARDSLLDVSIFTCIGGLSLRILASWFLGRRKKDNNALAIVCAAGAGALVVLFVTFLFFFKTSSQGFQGIESYSAAITFYLGAIIIMIGFKNMQDKKAVDLFRQIENIQNDYYRSLEESQKEMARLRHDFKNILYTADALIIQKQYDQAGLLLDQTALKFDSTPEVQFSNLASLNAFLIQKKADLEKQGCHLIPQVDLADLKEADQMDLCLMFSLMVDQAASHTEDLQEKIIELKASAENGIITALCRFESRMKKTKKNPQSRIMLDQLISKYGGSLDLTDHQSHMELVIRLPYLSEEPCE